jgi:putative FmdB family regulatory protein
MPKYIYQCEACPGHFEIFHGMTEDEDRCPQCESKDFHRVPQIPFLKRSVEPKGGKVGDKVKAAIESNRDILKQVKKESNKEWEPENDD